MASSGILNGLLFRVLFVCSGLGLSAGVCKEYNAGSTDPSSEGWKVESFISRQAPHGMG